MNDTAREKLREIVAKNGESILQDPERCEGLLKDHCAAYRREISVLVGAMKERVPMELRGSWQTAMTPEAMRARLVQRLQEDRGLAPDVADWAVEAWSYALDISLGPKSDPVDENLLAGGDAAANGGGAGTVRGGMAAAGVMAAIDPDKEKSERNRRAELGLKSDRDGGVTPGPGPGPVVTPGSSKAGFMGSMTGQKKAGVAVAAVLLLLLAVKLWPHPDPTPHHDDNNPCAANDPNCKPDGSSSDPNAVLNTNGATVPARATVSVRVDQGLDSNQAQVGQTVSGVVAVPVYANGKVVIPEGSPVTMRVTQVNSARLKGVPLVTLSLVQVSVQGRNYPLSGSYTAHGAAHGKSTAVKTGIGAGIGAAIGAIAGGGKGAAIGAGLGAGGGLGAAAMTATPARIGAETTVSFRVSRLPAAE